MPDLIQRKLEHIETRLDKSAEDSAYNRGRLDEIALAVSHIPALVEQQRRIKSSVRHAWVAVVTALVSAGVALARSFL
jgi:hypothetical protein